MEETPMDKQRTWKEAFFSYKHPRVLGMLFLGFAAGLPFLLVFSTLSAWLKDEGVSLAVIGFFGWVGITYSIKVFWAPIVDQIRLPKVLGKFGRRRSWILLSQFGIIAGLVGMASSDPTTSLNAIIIFALLVAFSSATQDISLDAYRIEAVETDLQGNMATTYQLGYRLALLVAGGGALFIADYWNWSIAYFSMAAFMLIGVITVFIIREPETQQNTKTLSADEPMGKRIFHWFHRSVIAPFHDFFQRYGWMAVTILCLIGLYRIPDLIMGIMANPFYLDLGFTKTEIAKIVKLYGFIMTILGATFGGLIVVRFGLAGPLLLGAVLVSITNLLFAWLAIQGADTNLLIMTISADNLAAGMAGSIFIAYLSSLTNTAYTATQYALFSSLMTLPGKFLSGFSGLVVEAHGFATFFIMVSLTGIPAILLVLYLMRYNSKATNG